MKPTQFISAFGQNFTLASAIALLSAGSASAATIIANTNDWVRGGNQGDNEFDGSETLQLKNQNETNLTRFAFFRFDLTAGFESDLATATAVTFDLYLKSTGGTGDPLTDTIRVFGLADLADAGAGTTETTWGTDLTWNTRPDGDNNLSNSLTTFLGDTTINANSDDSVVSLTMNLSTFKTFVGNDTNGQITLILGSTGAGGTNNFASTTNTGGLAKPSLVTIPEPSSVLLIGLAGLGFVIRHRR